MAAARTVPFNQNVRINLLRIAAFMLLPLAVSFTPFFNDTVPGDIMEQVGILLIVGGILVRFWSILYIGNQKNVSVVQDGPYSMCRHPLYFGSTLAIFGFGLMMESAVFTAFLTLVVFLILSSTAKKEEAFLRHNFGPSYSSYASKTPRIFPDLTKFKTETDVEFNAHSLRRNFFDALVFLALIPLVEIIELIREADIFPQMVLI